MESTPQQHATVSHEFAEPVEGLTPGALLHRSRHADTVLGEWHGLDVVAKRVREDIEERDARTSAARGILREGMLLRRLDHHHIVRVVDIVAKPATLVLELIPGRTMREELRQRRRLPIVELARVGAQLANALDHLHDRSIMHRDVKPANVMYDGTRAVLIDFHLAREPGQMRGGAGTRLFSAPEQVRGGEVTSAADVWGLGTVLYRAATGRLPFHADTGHPQLTIRPVPALHRLATARYDGDVDRAAERLPFDAARLIDRMLAFEPGARPTAAECRAAFKDLRDTYAAETSDARAS